MDTVQDGRGRDWFWLDNAVIDEHGRDLGPIGIALYCTLARMADQKGQCYPAVPTLCERLNITEPTCRKYLKHIADLGLMSIQGRKDPCGDAASNLYTLTRVKPREVGKEISHPPNELTHGGQNAYPRVGKEISPKGTQSEQDSENKVRGSVIEEPAPASPICAASSESEQPLVPRHKQRSSEGRTFAEIIRLSLGAKPNRRQSEDFGEVWRAFDGFTPDDWEEVGRRSRRWCADNQHALTPGVLRTTAQAFHVERQSEAENRPVYGRMSYEPPPPEKIGRGVNDPALAAVYREQIARLMRFRLEDVDDYRERRGMPRLPDYEQYHPARGTSVS